MTKHAVSLRVTPYLSTECKFWLANDGWNGSSEHPPHFRSVSSFDKVKTDLEFALGKHIETLLERSRAVSSGEAA